MQSVSQFDFPSLLFSGELVPPFRQVRYLDVDFVDSVPRNSNARFGLLEIFEFRRVKKLPRNQESIS